ncbi:hypothetical protein ACRAWF_31710 [Streptomyces sp. L7]
MISPSASASASSVSAVSGTASCGPSSDPASCPASALGPLGRFGAHGALLGLRSALRVLRAPLRGASRHDHGLRALGGLRRVLGRRGLARVVGRPGPGRFAAVGTLRRAGTLRTVRLLGLVRPCHPGRHSRPQPGIARRAALDGRVLRFGGYGGFRALDALDALGILGDLGAVDGLAVLGTLAALGGLGITGFAGGGRLTGLVGLTGFVGSAGPAVRTGPAGLGLARAPAASEPPLAPDGPSVSPSSTASARSSRIEKIFVAVSTPPRWDDGDVASRATARRGSRSDLASGTGLALPDVGSADDSRCFDLSGDSPATDASSMSRTPTVRQPNRPR